jgi:hypothetical protein
MLVSCEEAGPRSEYAVSQIVRKQIICSKLVISHGAPD